MKIPTICRYCGGKVTLSTTAELYEKSNDPIFLCLNCNAYVSARRDTLLPMGKLANAVLRMKRRETHDVFDRFWKTQGMSRTQGYRWLAEELKMPEKYAHIAHFEMDNCERVIQLCRKQENKKGAA